MIFDSEKAGKLASLHRAALDAAKQTEDVEVDELVGCASALIAARAFDRALDILIGAIVLEPENARAWALAGVALERLRRFDEARYAYESALALGDLELPCALALAGLYQQSGEKDRALALAQWIAEEAEVGETKAKALALERSLAGGPQ